MHHDAVQAIEDGMNEALTDLMRAATDSRHSTEPMSRDNAGRDHFGRALASLGSAAVIGARPFVADNAWASARRRSH